MAVWTEEEFEESARCLSQVLWNVVLVDQQHDNDTVILQWSVEDTSPFGNVYLTLNHPIQRQSAEFPVGSSISEEDMFVDGTLLPDPDAHGRTAINSGAENDAWWMSIVYSDTWRVPVIYFNVIHSNGRVYTRDEVVKLLTDQKYHQNQVENLWEFVSHDEHPVTGVPSLFLHPCRTQERLDLLASSMESGAEKLWIWMALMLPSIGFSIKPRIFQLVQQNLKGEKKQDT